MYLHFNRLITNKIALITFKIDGVYIVYTHRIKHGFNIFYLKIINQHSK